MYCDQLKFADFCVLDCVCFLISPLRGLELLELFTCNLFINLIIVDSISSSWFSLAHNVLTSLHSLCFLKYISTYFLLRNFNFQLTYYHCFSIRYKIAYCTRKIHSSFIMYTLNVSLTRLMARFVI
jgi:hypothetical protein